MAGVPFVRSSTAWFVATVAVLGSALPAAAGAAPAISGTDGDVWNVAKPVPSYVLTGSTNRARIYWDVAGENSGNGRSPVTVTLRGLVDGKYTLSAREGSRLNLDVRTRAFRVDLTPPVITIRQPVGGAEFDQDAAVTADYSCDGALTCVGTVASGALLDTATPGPKTLSVQAVDDAGNSVSAAAAYTVRFPPPIPTAPPPAAPLAAPVVAAPALIPTIRPTTINATTLLPRAGVVVGTRRPLLRWPRRVRASVYNVQLFRLRGTTATKVLSAFPREALYRIPPKRIAFGDRYLWRVWPYLADGYPRRPLGLSYFDVRSSAG